MADNRTAIIITAKDDASSAIGKVGDSLGRLGNQANSIASLKGALGGLTTALSVGGLIAFSKGIIDTADNLNDLSQRTGIGVRALASWQLAAEQSGTSLDAVAKGIKGLGKNILENGEALRAAGITATNANDALIQTADLFASLPDGIEKTTLATALFGKAGMELIPMLNLGSKGLAEAQEKAAAYAAKMEELAPRADEFNDKLKELELVGKAAAINGILPIVSGLTGLVDLFRDATSGAEGLARAMRFMSEAVSAPSFLKNTIFDTPSLLLKGGAALADGARPGQSATAAQLLAKQEPALPGQNSQAERDALARANKLRAALGEKEKTGRTKTEKDDYGPLIRQITERNALLSAEASSTDRLTAAQQFAIMVRTDMENGYVKLTEAQKKTVAAKLDELIANDQLNQATEARRKALEAEAKAAGEYFDQEEKARLLVEDTIAGNRQLIERAAQQQTLIGLRERERQVVQAVRQLEDEAAEARRSAYRDIQDPGLYAQTVEQINNALEVQKAQLAETTGAVYDYANSWQAGATQALNEYLDEVDNMASQSSRLVKGAFKGMEDALVEFVKTGKLDFKSLADSIISDLIRIQVQQNFTKPLAKALESGGGLSGFFSSLFGGGGYGDAAGVAAGVPRYAQGTPYVPEDGLAFLHKGEAVIPAEYNKGGMGGASVVINAPIDARGADASVVPQLRQALAELEARIYKNVPAVMGRAAASRMIPSAY